MKGKRPYHLIKTMESNKLFIATFSEVVAINVSGVMGYKSGILMHQPFQRRFPGLTF